MKNLQALFTLTLLLGLLSGCDKDTQVTLQINSDNTAKLSIEITHDRQSLQRWADRVAQQRSDEVDDEVEWDEGSEPVTPSEPSQAEAAPATVATSSEQQQAEARLRKFIEARYSHDMSSDNEHVKQTINAIDITAETVKVSVSWTYADLKTCIASLPDQIHSDARVQLEKTDDGNLALTFTNGEWHPNTADLVKTLKRSHGTGQLTIIMPGKIIESSLPTSDQNTTSLAFDSVDEKSVTLVAETLVKPIRVVAEPGGVDLSVLPLDSAALVSVSDPFHEAVAPDAELPLVDATTPFITEAVTVISHQVHDYPDAAEFAEQLQFTSYPRHSGCQVSARVFPSEAQRIITVTGLKVISAKDDRDRPIPSAAAYTSHFRQLDRTFNSDEAESNDKPVSFSVELQLPAPDARAIETIQGELIAITFDAWKIQRLEQIRPSPDTAIDIKDVLPGASIVIRRMRTPQLSSQTGGSDEGIMQFRITGPKEIRNLQVSVQVPGYSNIHSYPVYESTTDVDGHTIREMTLQYMLWGRDANQTLVPKPTLIVRYPAGLKQMRIPFTLQAMDLY